MRTYCLLSLFSLKGNTFTTSYFMVSKLTFGISLSLSLLWKLRYGNGSLPLAVLFEGFTCWYLLSKTRWGWYSFVCFNDSVPWRKFQKSSLEYIYLFDGQHVKLNGIALSDRVSIVHKIKRQNIGPEINIKIPSNGQTSLFQSCIP